MLISTRYLGEYGTTKHGIVLDMNVRISSAIEGYDWYVILDER